MTRYSRGDLVRTRHKQRWLALANLELASGFGERLLVLADLELASGFGERLLVLANLELASDKEQLLFVCYIYILLSTSYNVCPPFLLPFVVSYIVIHFTVAL